MIYSTKSLPHLRASNQWHQTWNRFRLSFHMQSFRHKNIKNHTAWICARVSSFNVLASPLFLLLHFVFYGHCMFVSIFSLAVFHDRHIHMWKLFRIHGELHAKATQFFFSLELMFRWKLMVLVLYKYIWNYPYWLCSLHADIVTVYERRRDFFFLWTSGSLAYFLFHRSMPFFVCWAMMTRCSYVIMVFYRKRMSRVWNTTRCHPHTKGE